ncbi:amidohydrolase family protein [Listeria grayi]|uniref:Amidohydrolase family protein n=1 Tax=Listeria grayi DSM 20601 TaxID=525367 RepID=D7UWZ2_LISGR|nr:amidohydrolase family protein [Listeria grayi]EFI84200.1 amidohydrolase family protein [Listeria grayi DSM 20601]
MTKTQWFQNVSVETGFINEKGYVNRAKLETKHLQVQDGKIIKIVAGELPATAGEEVIDMKGQLVLPGLVEKHCHLDKTKLGTDFEPVSPAKNIVERFESEISQLNALKIAPEKRTEALLDIEIDHGVSFFRSHVDVEPACGLDYLENVKRAIQKYKHPIGYELIAFPQHGFLRSESQSLVRQALENGATIIGGVDPYTLDQDYKKSLEQKFEIAAEYQAGIDLHVHDRDEAGKATIKEIIRLTKAYNWQDKVSISHAFGLNDFTGEERKTVFQALADEKIHIISSIPITPNTIPPLVELQSYGVPVHIGCDNVYDSWSAYGDGNIQEKLARYGELFGIKTLEGMTASLGLVTNGITTLNPAGEPAWPFEGAEATFLFTKANSSAEFVARQTSVTHSYYQGEKIK